MSGSVTELNEQNFIGAISSPTPTVVDFWAPWCGPCRLMAPALEKIAAEFSGKITFAKLNVDDNPETASQYGIQGIPTVIIFKNGKEIDRNVGMMPEADLRGFVTANQ